MPCTSTPRSRSRSAIRPAPIPNSSAGPRPATETHQLKELLAELMMENRLLKKSVLGDGEADI
jgi:hypothetical protein